MRPFFVMLGFVALAFWKLAIAPDLKDRRHTNSHTKAKGASDESP